MGSWDTGTSALPHSVVYFFDVCRIIRQHTSQHTSTYGFLRQCHVCLASCCCICILVLSYICVLILCVLIQADPALLVSRDRYSVYLLCWYNSTNTDAGGFFSGTDALLLVHDYAYTLRVAWVVEVCSRTSHKARSKASSKAGSKASSTAFCRQLQTCADVCWRMLTYADICSRMLTDAHGCWRMLCWRMLTTLLGARWTIGAYTSQKSGTRHRYAHVCCLCSRMLLYAHVCSCMLTYAHVCSRILTYAGVCWRVLTYAHVCSRMLTYGTRHSTSRLWRP
jgi:hypothetical protein